MILTRPDCTKDSSQNFSSEQERQAVIKSLVESLTETELEQYTAFHPKDLGHYLKSQNEWLQDSKYFLGIDLGHKPDEKEFAEKILSTSHSQRYRAFYSLCYPEKTIINIESL